MRRASTTLLAVACAAVATALETDADVATCLAGHRTPCDARRKCHAVEFTRACLRTRVPWRTPFHRARRRRR